MRTVAVSTARDHFTDLVNEVVYRKEPLTLTRRGRPLAILAPIHRGKPERGRPRTARVSKTVGPGTKT